jgi:hypothetical protein
MSLLWIIVIVLLVLWLLGFIGRSRFHFGNWIHILIVIAVILVILKLLGIV